MDTLSSSLASHLCFGAKGVETLGIPGSGTKSPMQKEPLKANSYLLHSPGCQEWMMEFKVSFPAMTTPLTESDSRRDHSSGYCTPARRRRKMTVDYLIINAPFPGSFCPGFGLGRKGGAFPLATHSSLRTTFSRVQGAASSVECRDQPPRRETEAVTWNPLSPLGNIEHA